MSPSTKELLATVQRYYESGSQLHSALAMSPETEQRQAKWTQWLEDMAPWREFRAHLSQALPSFLVGETYSTHDGGPRCIVYPPKASLAPTSNWVVVGCISLLAPVYVVHGVVYDCIDGRLRNPVVSFEPPPPDMALPVRMVARMIETAFGYSAVPRGILDTPVPLVAGSREPPDTTLFHALFTNEPARLP